MNSVQSFCILIEDFNLTVYNPANQKTIKSSDVFQGLEAMSKHERFLKEIARKGFRLSTNLGTGFWETYFRNILNNMVKSAR